MSAPNLIYPPSSGGGGGGVSGSGTPNTIPIWATATSLSDSPLSYASSTLTYASGITTQTFASTQTWNFPSNAFAWNITAPSGKSVKWDSSNGYLGLNVQPSAPLHVESAPGTTSPMVSLRNTMGGTNSYVTVNSYANNMPSALPSGQIRNVTTGTTPGYGTYDWQFRLPDPGGPLQQVFSMSAPTGAASLTITNGGTGYTNGTYSQATLLTISGAGGGATADVVVAGGIITTCILRNPGSGYAVGDTLLIAGIGAGSSQLITVASVGSTATSSLAVTAPRIGGGTNNPRAALDVVGGAIIDGSQFVVIPQGSAAPSARIEQLSLIGTIAPTASSPPSISSFSTTPYYDLTNYAGTVLFNLRSNPELVVTPAASNPSARCVSASFTRRNAGDLTTTGTFTSGSFGFFTASGVGSASTGNVYLVEAGFANNASGHTISVVQNFRATNIVASGATVTTLTQFYGSAIGSTGGTITTLYGLRLEASTTPTITNRWGISQEDTLATNLFAATTNTFSGSVRATGSSAGSPALSTPGDTDTGIYFPAANQIRMSTGGSPGLGIDSSQNLQFNSGYGSIATAYGCRAWVNFNGTGVVAIRASGNVSSITDNGVGDYTVNLTNAMPDANYDIGVAVGHPLPGAPGAVTSLVNNARGVPTTALYHLYTLQGSFATVDAQYIYSSVRR